DGIDLSDLEEKLQIKPTPKFIYVIPNFQNPTGITMSLEKRKAVYELCKKYGVLILEDNPYGQLRFSGEAVPPIKSFDEEGIVIYAASFSKIIAPGIRVACAVGKPKIIGAIKQVKFLNDVHSTTWSQVICERILATCDMDAQIEKLKEIYGAKNKVMQDEMAKNFHPSVKYTKPEGGMFVWVTLPDGVDMMKFVGEALENKVALVPGTAFLADTSMPCQSFRMNFSTPSTEDIIKGIEILGKLTYKYCK
ncbi:MAG: PLP-dependent aminotransferase family protein, partial [Clostridiales bacterium]|nr:PLP-dependent aminotransferase family protein [Clostridiales bacterium]